MAKVSLALHCDKCYPGCKSTKQREIINDTQYLIPLLIRQIMWCQLLGILPGSNHAHSGHKRQSRLQANITQGLVLRTPSYTMLCCRIACSYHTAPRLTGLTFPPYDVPSQINLCMSTTQLSYCRIPCNFEGRSTIVRSNVPTKGLTEKRRSSCYQQSFGSVIPDRPINLRRMNNNTCTIHPRVLDAALSRFILLSSAEGTELNIWFVHPAVVQP